MWLKSKNEKHKQKIMAKSFCKLAENISFQIQQDQQTCKQDNHEESQSSIDQTSKIQQ